MDAQRAFTITYASLVALFNTILYILSEASIDVYISINIISYYLSYIIYLRGERASMPQKAINIIFILILVVIMVYRAYKVISK